MHSINRSKIVIPENRQRKDIDPELIVELQTSILSKSGLLHPPVFRKVGDLYHLVAGERRLRAIDLCHAFALEFRCGQQMFSEPQVPGLLLAELSDLEVREAELEENIRRVDLSWQDRAQATADLMALRTDQARAAGQPAPSFADIKQELTGSPNNKDTVRTQVIVSRHLDQPEVRKARTIDEALKIIKRKEELGVSAQLAKSVGLNFSSSSHTCLHGSCLDLLTDMKPESQDVILTDPPYGMGAQDFSDSGRALGGGGGDHFYDDSYEAWLRLIPEFINLTLRVAKPQSHLYCFCDIERFPELKTFASLAGWTVFRTPLMWVNPTAMRAPWPTMGPQRKYQTILYAVRGSKPVNHVRPDVLVHASDANLNHHAQKPVSLYEDLLSRSVRPGDSILDPFCGTGPIFPACHSLTCRATGMELDAASYGIAVSRLQLLTAPIP